MSWINPVWSLLIVGHYLSARSPSPPPAPSRSHVWTSCVRACVYPISPITFDMKKRMRSYIYSYIDRMKNARTVWSYMAFACFRHAVLFILMPRVVPYLPTQTTIGKKRKHSQFMSRIFGRNASAVFPNMRREQARRMKYDALLRPLFGGS